MCHTHPNLTTLAEVRRLIGREFAIRHVTIDEFEGILTEAYARDSSEARQMVEDMGEEMDLASLAESVPETEDLLEQEDDAPIIRLINALLAESIRENASDVHIETFEKDLVVRFRVDGVMREVVRPKRELAALLVSRIKVMARLRKKNPPRRSYFTPYRRSRGRRACKHNAGKFGRAGCFAFTRQTGRAPSVR